jgi:hypothetical protein
MRVRVSDPDLALELVEFFRARPYLAVRRGSTTVDVEPINVLSERADRARVVRLLDEWAEGHPGVGRAWESETPFFWA